MRAKLYTEKNFLNRRDLEAYKEKQAESCLFLLEFLGKWEQTACPDVKMVLTILMSVHQDQYARLGGKAEVRDYSYYFEKMYALNAHENDYERLLIHLVSYWRGFLRYAMLVGETQDDVWAELVVDAQNNRSLCEKACKMGLGVEYEAKLNKVILSEQDVMVEVDKRNGNK